MKKIVLILLAIILLVLIFNWVNPIFGGLVSNVSNESALDDINIAYSKLDLENAEEVVVYKAVDGDTLELVDGRLIRYIGIDAPEIEDNDCMSTEAKKANEVLVNGKTIKIIKDVSDVDKYDRLLRYVFVGKTFINEQLIKQGYARASNYPPDTKYSKRFKSIAASAKEAKLGIWSDECLADNNTSQ